MFAFPQKSVAGPCKKYSDALKFCSQVGITKANVYFVMFACFLFGGATLYQALGGDLLHLRAREQLRFASSLTEPLGLLVLWRKIVCQQSVTGISGMTMAMYVAVYGFRVVATMPRFSLDALALDIWAEVAIGSVSLVLVLSILRHVFVTHRRSYQHELDVVKAQYLFPACVVLALVARPNFHFWSGWTGFWWCACLYLDVVALIPQVVMMTRGGGKVEAPISHFVAATFMSRVMDLYDLSYAYAGCDSEEFISFCVVVLLHVLHLLLIADFMYYYLKAWVSGARFSDDLQLGVDIC